MPPIHKLQRIVLLLLALAAVIQILLLATR
jgi:hypothetical protein